MHHSVSVRINPSSPNRIRTCDFPITSSDALPLRIGGGYPLPPPPPPLVQMGGWVGTNGIYRCINLAPYLTLQVTIRNPVDRVTGDVRVNGDFVKDEDKATCKSC